MPHIRSQALQVACMPASEYIEIVPALVILARCDINTSGTNVAHLHLPVIKNHAARGC
jgi:hypothetical protein